MSKPESLAISYSMPVPGTHEVGFSAALAAEPDRVVQISYVASPKTRASVSYCFVSYVCLGGPYCYCCARKKYPTHVRPCPMSNR